MSEHILNDVIRQIGLAQTHLNYAEELADSLLQNHSVAGDLKGLKLDVKDYSDFLNTTYRQTHFTTHRR